MKKILFAACVCLLSPLCLIPWCRSKIIRLVFSFLFLFLHRSVRVCALETSHTHTAGNSWCQFYCPGLQFLFSRAVLTWAGICAGIQLPGQESAVHLSCCNLVLPHDLSLCSRGQVFHVDFRFAVSTPTAYAQDSFSISVPSNPSTVLVWVCLSPRSVRPRVKRAPQLRFRLCAHSSGQAVYFFVCVIGDMLMLRFDWPICVPVLLLSYWIKKLDVFFVPIVLSR
jgi:hypothetical protein